MMDIIRKIFEADFMPHGHCYFWRPEIVWTDAISDSIIALAYFSIPLTLIYIVKARKDFRYYWLLLLFATFILGCGATHVMDVINIWKPLYRLDSLIRVITAIASIGTAITLIKITPYILLIPDAEIFKKLNEDLKIQLTALEERNIFIQTLTSTSPNKLYVYDLIHHKNIFTNKNFKEFPAYSPEELLSMEDSISEFIHPDDFYNLKKYYEAIKNDKSNDTKLIEYRIKSGENKWRWYFLSGRIFKRDKSGAPVESTGVIMDITDRKETEKNLKESQKFIEKITNTTPDTIYIINLNTGKIEYINTSSQVTIDKTIEEVNVKAIFHPDDFKKLRKRLPGYKYLNTQDIVTLEFRIKDVETGGWRWLTSRETPFERGSDGLVSHILGVTTDVTEIKAAQEELKSLNTILEKKVEERTLELKRREHLLNTVTNSIPALISYVDYKETYLLANKYYEDYITSGEVVGRSINDVLGDEEYQHNKPYIENASKGQVQLFESTLQLKDGSTKIFEINYLPDIDEDTVKGVVIMGLDRTERINYEKQLKAQNIQLKKINNDLDNFIYTASHDLKSPITNMEALIEFVNEEMHDKYTTEERSLFDMLRISIEKLRQTIHDLTEISYIQKEVNGTSEIIHIKDIINDFKIEHQHFIIHNKVNFSEDLKVPDINYSKKNFRSILYNLLTNAIKYRSPHRKSVIEISTEKSNENKIILTVKDNGLGLTSNQQENLFRMFKRFHDHIEGSGIGLYMVKRIVENNGGKIEVESELDKGTSFKIYF